jgi:hypothetical protein
MTMTENTQLLFLARYNGCAMPLGIFASEELAIKALKDYYEGANPGSCFSAFQLRRYGSVDFASSVHLIVQVDTSHEDRYEVYVARLDVQGFKVVTTIA